MEICELMERKRKGDLRDPVHLKIYPKLIVNWKKIAWSLQKHFTSNKVWKMVVFCFEIIQDLHLSNTHSSTAINTI